MAIEKVVNVVVNIKGGTQTTQQIEKLNTSLKKVKASTGEVATGMKQSGNAILENGGAMGLLNDLTGGYAMTVKDAVEASGLFTKGTTIASTAQKAYALVVGSTTGALKALRVALVTTGLGALVVAIGYLVSKMGEASDATEELTADQERLNKQLVDTKKNTDDLIKGLDYYTSLSLSLAKRRGASNRELKAIEIDGINSTIQANQDEINAIKATQDEEYKLTSEQNKRIQELRDQNLTLLRQGRLAVIEFETEQTVKERELANENARKAREDAQKAREQAEKERKEFEESVRQGQIDLQLATTEAEFEQGRLRVEEAERVARELQKIAEEQTRIEKEEAEKRKLFYEITEKSKVDITNNTFSLLGALAKKGGALAKAVAIADVIRGQVSSVSKIISSTAEANAKAVALSPLTAGQPFVTLNTVSAGIGIASSVAGAIKAIKDINSESKSAGGGSISGGGGASAPPAPSFNLVEGTGANQIASGLANQRQPIQAYVTSGAVTSAQQLDRNIIRDASL